MPNFVLVLKMADHLGLAGQGPLEAAAVGRGVLLRRADPNVGHVHLAGGLVDGMHEALHEDVHLRVLVAVVGDFEAVIQEDVSWKLRLKTINNHHGFCELFL